MFNFSISVLSSPKKKHISILKKGVLKAFGAFGFTEPNF